MISFGDNELLAMGAPTNIMLVLVDGNKHYIKILKTVCRFTL